ncbi:ABC transporter ATP-binding protein [uncultured Sphaerochaeta sp.]|uniref:ABC transporter ATP-binding protein n=1 Tax=uncultured Sphaerochaeta sp. TaxID=886478 RepID=UPI002A0A71AF|nr:ABC transporter ATP-binding protein [uncultured Sphaerochaeta sp.]
MIKKKNLLKENFVLKNSEDILEVENLKVNIRIEADMLNAVRGVNFSIKKGETLGLVGESGCGKSVTSKEILGINPSNCASSGRILYQTKSGKVINLLDLDKDGELYRSIRGTEIAMIFQEPMTAFSPLFTIGNQISEIILIHEPETKKDEAKRRVIEMLAKVGIADPQNRFEQYPHEFSGGMLQRALIAMMLCCDPVLLIADEPTTALDVTIQSQILELMIKLQREYNMSILFITHDLGIVASMCDRVAVMYLGEIVETGSVRQIFKDGRHPYTRGLLRSLPKMNQNSNDKLFTIEGTVPIPIDFPVRCGFYDRCTLHKQGICDCRKIDTLEVNDGHFVKCILEGGAKNEF